jgi:protease-4
MSESNIAREILSTLVKEKKRDRRWQNIRFFIWVALIVLVFLSATNFTSKISSFFLSDDTKSQEPYVSLVRLKGVIMADKDFSAENVIPYLIHAFQDKDAKGVVLMIDSPGGSAVQASIIHDKIRALKKQYHKKVVVVGGDALASGAYLVSVAADRIYVNASTITGSIGVVLSGFGLNQAIDKLGISRRLFTAGIHKARLDAFEPLNQGDADKVKRVLDQVHQDFINYVKAGRAGKLKLDDASLFSGDFWNGSEAVKIGLADGTSNLWDILKHEFDVKHYIDYSARPSLVQSLLKNIQTSLSDALIPSMRLQAQLT